MEEQTRISSSDPSDSSDSSDSDLPTSCGQYRIIGKLGQGGMGTVYKGVHETLEREAAIKFLPLQFSSDPPKERQLLLICSNVVDQQNLGAILRSCGAFGVDGVILCKGTADPFSRRVLRVSMGAALDMPIWKSENLPACLQRLRAEHGFKFFASVVDARATIFSEISPSRRTGLVFGNEGFGLEADVLEACDESVTIPIQANIDSLNVSAAAGILLYAFSRNG